jgi:hypothetical protein
MAIRGHFSTRSEDDADVLEMLALDCVRNLDELLAPVTVVIVTVGERKIEVIKTFETTRVSVSRRLKI